MKKCRPPGSRFTQKAEVASGTAAVHPWHPANILQHTQSVFQRIVCFVFLPVPFVPLCWQMRLD